MAKKSLIVLLLFVVIAGAIAGAFVFLSQIGAGGSSAVPGIYTNPSGAATQQKLSESEAAAHTQAARISELL